MLGIRIERDRGRAGGELVRAALAGALAVSILGVARDARRRARVRQFVDHGMHRSAELIDKAGRDAQNRLHGVASVARRALEAEYVSDDRLVARVRSRLGRIVSHPHAVVVGAKDGVVVLSGPILSAEVDRVLREIRRVRGVREVDARLEVYDRPGGVPALQSHVRTPLARPEVMQEHWTPSLRVAAAAGGLFALGAAVIGRGGLRRLLATALGALLFARAWMDAPVARVLGIGTGRRGVSFHKTITIHAPVEEVFAYMASFEAFPVFMDHVEDVKAIGERRSHWRVRGPAGTKIEWDCELTRMDPNEVIAWKTVEGSTIKHAGIVRFEPLDDDRATRLDIRLTYNPVVGAAGHLIAVLFGVDPKKSLDEDLVRLKSLIEDGKARAHGYSVTRPRVSLEPGDVVDPTTDFR